MKKAFTLFFFLFTVLLYSADKTTIDYYSFFFPGIQKSSYYNAEYPHYKDILKMISRETGVDLNIYQNLAGRKSGRERLEEFVSELKEALYTNPPDLVYVPFTRWPIWRSLVTNGDFMQVDELIKQHAPNLYQSYPPQFWEYRKEKGNVHSIPIKRYEEYYDSGFWIIKKDNRIIGQDYKSKLDILYDNLMNCSDYFKNSGMAPPENYLLSFFYWGEDLINWFRLQNVLPVGLGEFYFIPRMNQVVPLSIGDVDVERYRKFDTKIRHGYRMGSYVYYFLKKKWKVAHVPYHQVFIENYRWKDILPEIFSNTKYEYISPEYSSEMVVFDSYDELFIPAGSDSVKETLEFIDTIYSQKRWYDIFMFGKEDFETDKPDEYDYNDVSLVTQNRSSLFSPLQVLCNKRFTRIPAFYPSEIKKTMHEYFEAEEKAVSHQLYGFDMSTTYYTIPNYMYRRDWMLIDMLKKMQESGAYVSELRSSANYLNEELNRYMK